MSQAALDTYINNIQREMKQSDAREHAYRPALKDLLESLGDFHAVNDAAHIKKVGAPDYILKRDEVNVAFVEAKDVNVSLAKTERTDQMKRYLEALPNLILTDYVEFRWYYKGEHQKTTRLGKVTVHGDKSKALAVDAQGVSDTLTLLNQFAQSEIPTVQNAEELAQYMAGMTREITRLVEQSLPESKNLPAVKEAFEKTLIPNLSARQFADMYAQTLAYGLFATRMEYTGQADAFTLQTAFWEVPQTNPFLREFFQQIARDLDEGVEYQVNALVGLLANAQTDEILEGFGRRTRQEDPIVHFYETFLREYDPKQRERRGVYYTPEPVVSYIVRSVDHILRATFGRYEGLADPDVTILDPATGTGTFLYFVIQQIYERVVEENGMGKKWGKYVSENLLPRIFGFELLVAPYAVAHMKLGLQIQDTLKQTGHATQFDERIGVYLTNTLEELDTDGQMRLPMLSAIADEGREASEIKRKKPIMVVLGNPPYSANSANKGDWITNLIKQTYYPNDHIKEHNPKLLLDDYVKFIRFGQWRIEQTGLGVLALITNHGFLDNITFRQMRRELMDNFTDIYLINLHGNVKKNETTPDGLLDENVFDIQQGVAISFFVRNPENIDKPTQVYYSDFWGKRTDKYSQLVQQNIEQTDWSQLEPQAPYYFFIPRDASRREEYNKFISLRDIMPISSMGVKTNRDYLLVDFQKDELIERISHLADKSLEDAEIINRYGLKDGKYWNTTRERQKIREIAWKENIVAYSYRVFDDRWALYQQNLIEIGRGGAATPVMKHLLNGDNLALCTTRQVLDEFRHVLCTKLVSDNCSLSSATRERTTTFPLYTYSSNQKIQRSLFDTTDSGEWALSAQGRRPNLSKAFVEEFAGKLGLTFITDGMGDLVRTFGPEDILHYAYAVFHSPTYRERYAEFLKIDFPRLPLTSDVDLFRTLAGFGAELVKLHLMDRATLGQAITQLGGEGDDTVPAKGGFPKYDEKEQRVYFNKTQYFAGVGAEVWVFHVGGYQVLHKWLKDRRGRELSYDELMHYQFIVVALQKTMDLMTQIDDAIPSFPLE